MKHMSLRLIRQNRNHQQPLIQTTGNKALWPQVLVWLSRRAAAFKQRRQEKRANGKVRLDQLSDHVLKDIGLRRDSFPGDRVGRHSPVQYTEPDFQHKALRDLQSDLIRYLPREDK